jgi:hypothetical protein
LPGRSAGVEERRIALALRVGLLGRVGGKCRLGAGEGACKSGGSAVGACSRASGSKGHLDGDDEYEHHRSGERCRKQLPAWHFSDLRS